MEDTIRPFVEACMAANNTMLEIFNARLGLPDGALARRHLWEEHSVSEARCIRVPPSPGSTKIAVGAHTDFGRLVSFLALKELRIIHSPIAYHSWQIDWVDFRLCYRAKQSGNM